MERVFELILQGVPSPSHSDSVPPDNFSSTGGLQFVWELQHVYSITKFVLDTFKLKSINCVPKRSSIS